MEFLRSLNGTKWPFITAVCRGQTSTELSDVYSTVVAKQGCPILPTLLSLYVDRISDYIVRRNSGIRLVGQWIPIPLCTDYNVLKGTFQKI